MAVSKESPQLNSFSCFDECLLQDIYDEASVTLSSLTDFVAAYDPSVQLHEDFIESLLQETRQQGEVSFTPFSFGARSSAFFLDRKCCLQKDQGKGQVVGTNVCARGKDQCLKKILQKLEVLTKFAKDSASVNRRKARVAAETPEYLETRSMIDARIGFLTMTYGVLLRWNRNGKIIFIVFRKMCHDSFYTKELERPIPLLKTCHTSFRGNNQKLDSSTSSLNPLQTSREEKGTHVYLQGRNGMDVILIGDRRRHARRLSI
mmetsp:Transcript_1353/g.2048  ORF Transcript_1353/g.2048 Transcript_1353/m.2048 type:complete len:261 (-) Transcript_1353:79-861(-)